MEAFLKDHDKRVGVLVGLKRINDLDLIDNSNLFAEIGFKTEDRSVVLRITELISLLYDGFDYQQSPEFLESIKDKSHSFIAMKKKLLTPKRINKKRLKFSLLLEQLPGSIEVIQKIIPKEQHLILRELCELIDQLSQ